MAREGAKGMKTIERLRELLDRCKFGTTKVERTDGDMEVGCPDRFDVIAENGDAIATMYLREQSRCEDGAALLSELCNALPALLAVVEDQQREIENAREFRRRCCEYTLSYLDAKGERVMDVEKRLISGYCKLKDNTDDALRKLDEVTP